MNMFRLVDQVLAYGVDGDLVELGCNSVKSSVLISKIMRHYNYEKKLYVYDSFEGLPPLERGRW
jgi:O-methyltransferase